jgi:hypothetical protein
VGHAAIIVVEPGNSSRRIDARHLGARGSVRVECGECAVCRPYKAVAAIVVAIISGDDAFADGDRNRRNRIRRIKGRICRLGINRAADTHSTKRSKKNTASAFQQPLCASVLANLPTHFFAPPVKALDGVLSDSSKVT